MHEKATIQWLFQYVFNITLQSPGNAGLTLVCLKINWGVLGNFCIFVVKRNYGFTKAYERRF